MCLTAARMPCADHQLEAVIDKVCRLNRATTQSVIYRTDHISHKATVAAPTPLIIITWPHDLHTCQVAKPAKLLLQDLLIDVG